MTERLPVQGGPSFIWGFGALKDEGASHGVVGGPFVISRAWGFQPSATACTLER